MTSGTWGVCFIEEPAEPEIHGFSANRGLGFGVREHGLFERAQPNPVLQPNRGMRNLRMGKRTAYQGQGRGYSQHHGLV